MNLFLFITSCVIVIHDFTKNQVFSLHIFPNINSLSLFSSCFFFCAARHSLTDLLSHKPVILVSTILKVIQLHFHSFSTSDTGPYMRLAHADLSAQRTLSLVTFTNLPSIACFVWATWLFPLFQIPHLSLPSLVSWIAFVMQPVFPSSKVEYPAHCLHQNHGASVGIDIRLKIMPS